MSRSPLHADWPIASLHQWVMPALANRQFRLYHNEGKPVAYVSWARLSDDVEQAYVRNARNLRPDQWQSGERLWFVDMIGEGGFGKKALHDLKNNVFPDEVGRALRWRKGSDTLHVFYLHGKNAVQKARDPGASPTVLIEAR